MTRESLAVPIVLLVVCTVIGALVGFPLYGFGAGVLLALIALVL